MTQFVLRWPESFDEEEATVSAKGYLDGVVVETKSADYELSFYDPVRLRQDAELSLANGRLFYVAVNLVIIGAVTRRDIERAVESLVAEGLQNKFRANAS